MKNYSTTSIINIFILDLLGKIQEQIDLNILLKQIPAFTSLFTISYLAQMSELEIYPSPMQRMIRQQNMIDIPKIEKDSLMPKDLSQQKVRVQSPRQNSPKSSVSSMRKIGFKRRQSSNLVQKLQSISFTQKKSVKKRSKKDQNAYQPLHLEEKKEQEQNIDSLRQKAQTRLQYLDELQKMQKIRQKSYQQRLNQYQQIISQDPKNNITYDYEGDPLKSNIEDHQNLKLNMTKTGIGFATRKLKDGAKYIHPQQSKVQVRQRIVKSLREQYNGPLKPLQMPLFQMKFNEDQGKNLKLEQYKKFYGRKYNRLDQRNHTIDMNATTKTSNRQQGFKDKKHLKDNNDEQHNIGKQKSINRKLALPKLNGKYKVLDRYQ